MPELEKLGKSDTIPPDCVAGSRHPEFPGNGQLRLDLGKGKL